MVSPMPNPALRSLSHSVKLFRLVPPSFQFIFRVRQYALTAPFEKCSQAFKIRDPSLPASLLKYRGIAMSLWILPCKWHHLYEERAVNELGDEEQFCVNS